MAPTIYVCINTTAAFDTPSNSAERGAEESVMNGRHVLSKP